MNGKKRAVFLVLAVCLLVFARAATASSAAGSRWPGLELDMAGGGSLHGNGDAQLMLLAALQKPVSRDLLLRGEPTFEYLNAKGAVMYVAGASLVARLIAPRSHRKPWGLTPFADLGAGLNCISRNHFAGRRLGGHFVFDLVVGGGLYLSKRISLSYRYRHLSNAGLFSCNEGVDSYYILLGVGI